MKTGDIARYFGVSERAVQRWVKEFEKYLTPSNTRHRVYSDDDMRVLAVVAKYSHESKTYDEIRERLEAGERVESEDLTPLYGSDTRMIPAAALEATLDATEIRVELESVKLERDRLIEDLEAERSAHDQTRQKVEELQNQLAALQRELGRAEGRLEEKDKPRRWWG